MSEKINPYYNPEQLDLEMIEFDGPDLTYEFDILLFWRTKEGLVFSASDSGCSCPTPFEDYEGANQKEVIQKLERVKDYSHALGIFTAWNRDYDENLKVPSSEIESLKPFFQK